MRVEVLMPQLGESIVEGTVVTWLKEPGDEVRREEDILTISTDKVDADIPSPAAGILEEVLVDVGATVEVGSVIAYIQTDAAAAKVVPTGTASTTAAKTDSGNGSVPASISAELPSASASSEVSAQTILAAHEDADIADLRQMRSSPLVRNIAQEHGVDLSVVPGTGISGRVTKQDIMRFIAGETQPLPATAAPAAKPSTTPSAAPASAAPVSAATPAASRPAQSASYGEDRIVPLDRMRMAIAKHMTESRRTSAHAHTVWECDWLHALSVRERLKTSYRERGVNLTVTAMLVQAAVRALKAYPILNTSMEGDNIRYRSKINVGVAVAIDDGLIVPVLKGADELNLLGIARGVNDLAERARNKKLKPTDIEGGTFTVSNPGVFGSTFGIPIINQPQVAILGVGGIKRTVTADENDRIYVTRTNMMCLSFDHRVIDGASADGFMKVFVDSIKKFEES
ncbi:MAG: 2-oxo acid dehydrogenase subunit E2 [Myxococcales bacterium]|nr:2-oxo acid dehydrogenase subunit E2 [Myxococcales bacterium]